MVGIGFETSYTNKERFNTCNKVWITMFVKKIIIIIRIQFTCGLSEERLLSMCSNITLEVEGGFL